MQEKPLRLVRLGELPVQREVPVSLVTDDRQVALGALHAQLVAAAGAGLEPDERRGEILLRVLDRLEMRLGRNVADGGRAIPVDQSATSAIRVAKARS